MLNPAAMVAIYWFIFGVVFPSNDPPLGDPSELHNYALFLICGLIPWNFFALTTGLGLGSISSNAGLVRRVAFPARSWCSPTCCTPACSSRSS